jgi:hypothetical protein
VLDQRRLVVSESDAMMRVIPYFEAQGIAHLKPALETGLKNMLLNDIATLDPKGLPKLTGERTTTYSMRANLQMLLEYDPKCLQVDPFLICEVWSGDRDCLDALQTKTAAYRGDLPSLVDLHRPTPAELRKALKAGTLNGVALPERSKPTQGSCVSCDARESTPPGRRPTRQRQSHEKAKPLAR